MEQKFIETVVLFDGQKEIEGSAVLEQEHHRKAYGMANIIYRSFIEDINASGAYLYIDASDRPTYRICEAPAELLEKLKAAGLNG